MDFAGPTRYMGPQARAYYLTPYLDYLASEASSGDIDAAFWLPPIAEEIVETGPHSAEILEQLLVALERVHTQFPRYAPERLSQRIYKELPGKARKAMGVLRRMKA